MSQTQETTYMPTYYTPSYPPNYLPTLAPHLDNRYVNGPISTYVCSTVSVLAVAVNVATIVAFAKLGTGGTPKIYYTIIAVLDLIEVVTKHFLYSFIGYGMSRHVKDIRSSRFLI